MRCAAALLLFASSASPALAQGLAIGATPGIPWLRLLLSLVFCLALAWGAVLLLRLHQRRGFGNQVNRLLKRQGVTTPRRIAILETRRASIHADLCLVQCDGRTYLLVLTPAGTTVLDRQDPTENAA